LQQQESAERHFRPGRFGRLQQGSWRTSRSWQADATNPGTLCQHAMKGWVVLFVASAAQAAEQGGPLLLTSGWQAVLEVPEVRAVAIDDPKIVSSSDLRDGHVTLLAGETGQTHLWAFVGPPEAARVVDYVVVVTRFPTLLPFAYTLSLVVDEHRVVRLPDPLRAEVGDRSICGVVSRAGELELTGRRAGTTTLLLWAEGQYRYALLTVRGGAVVPAVDELDEELTEPTDGRVVLRVGERGVLEMPAGLKALAMRDEQVAGVRPRDGELVFEGLQVGATHVLFWDERGTRSSRYVVVLPRVMGDPNPVPPPPPPDPSDEPLPSPARTPAAL
jgi:hypothetical protein